MTDSAEWVIQLASHRWSVVRGPHAWWSWSVTLGDVVANDGAGSGVGVVAGVGESRPALGPVRRRDLGGHVLDESSSDRLAGPRRGARCRRGPRAARSAWQFSAKLALVRLMYFGETGLSSVLTSLARLDRRKVTMGARCFSNGFSTERVNTGRHEAIRTVIWH